MLILGLDISSTTVGWAVIDSYGPKLVAHGHIKPMEKQNGSIVERLDAIATDIEALCKQWKPDCIGIEEITQFIARRSTANTIITLAVFNRACALQAYRASGKLPTFTLPTTIRSRISKTLGLKKLEKEDIPSVVHGVFGSNNFKFKVKKLGKNKGEPVKETYDEADAVAVALAVLMNMKTNVNFVGCSCGLCVSHTLNAITQTIIKKGKK